MEQFLELPAETQAVRFRIPTYQKQTSTYEEGATSTRVSACMRYAIALSPIRTVLLGIRFSFWPRMDPT